MVTARKKKRYAIEVQDLKGNPDRIGVEFRASDRGKVKDRMSSLMERGYFANSPFDFTIKRLKGAKR